MLVAHNEAKRLPDWFEHMAWADEIVVVDSGSTDRTAEMARTYTDRVFAVSNKLNFDINKNFGFEQAHHEWILSLDADERLTDALIGEIQAVVRDPACPYAGFEIPRRTFMLGREMRMAYAHLLRLFRNGKGRLPGETVHQSIKVEGAVGRLSGEILHHTDETISERVQRSDLYSECMAAHWYHQGRPFRLAAMLVEPAVHFVKLYFIKAGFRDGMAGFIIAASGAYSVFLRHAKLWTAHQFGRFPSPSDDYPPR